jgi:hypothetical protein
MSAVIQKVLHTNSHVFGPRAPTSENSFVKDRNSAFERVWDGLST